VAFKISNNNNNNLRLLRLQSNRAITQYNIRHAGRETTAATKGSTRPIYRRVQHS